MTFIRSVRCGTCWLVSSGWLRIQCSKQRNIQGSYFTYIFYLISRINVDSLTRLINFGDALHHLHISTAGLLFFFLTKLPDERLPR